MCRAAQIIYLRGEGICVWNLGYSLVLWCDIYLRTGWMCVQYLCYAAVLEYDSYVPLFLCPLK